MDDKRLGKFLETVYKAINERRVSKEFWALTEIVTELLLISETQTLQMAKLQKEVEALKENIAELEYFG